MNKFSQFVIDWLAGRRDEDVAAEFGLVSNSIRNWRLGNHLPPESKIEHLAPVFGVSCEALRKLLAEAAAQRRIQRRQMRSARQLVRR